MSRKVTREYAFLYIYQYAFYMDVDKQHFLEEYKIEDVQKEYFDLVLAGVEENIEDIDNLIFSNLKGWTMARISKIDLAILRLAIYEIKYMGDIPYKVSVNEAVELAKKYGEDTSKAFVNGLLAKIQKNKVAE